MQKKYAPILLLFIVVLFQSCAIRGVMLDEKLAENTTYDTANIVNSFFIAGNTYKNDTVFTSDLNRTVLANPSKEKRLIFIGLSLIHI